ncbi:MAG: D-cysteine desulfhydrase family protein [Anaerolineales bacterium]|nr:D-cysteine desulfhydrase family protein [Anaerolineales bacterium]
MIPRLKFAHLPTPIEAMPRLSEILGGPRLLVKRDDQTGLAFGGNKTRKLEFLVAEAQSQGAQTLITAGAAQSNHCRQTAAAAARFGFKCILVLSGDAPEQVSGNLLLDHLFGAEIIWTEKSQREAMLQQTFDQALGQGHKPYLVPYGGSNPVGALGYAFAMQELIQQMKDLRGLACPGWQARGDLGGLDWIVFASSSGGTQAGLVLGARLFGFGGKVLGISVDEPREVLQERVAKLATETSARSGERIAFSPEDVQVNADYCAAGYGVLTEGEREAVTLFARTEGLLLDPVYTGRAAAGMIDLIKKGFFKKDETVLFWHTGGTTALFAEKYQDALK